MSITPADMQREVIAFAMEEMRNRGLEEAARLVDRQTRGSYHLVQDIRALKRDPGAKLSDWWGASPAAPECYEYETPWC